MRGAERPGKVKWHRPFLPPLEPLSDSASRQIFLEVAYDPGAREESALVIYWISPEAFLLPSHW
ncbi:hypothetical protein DFH08DRAFT_99102 [Mycena albidolilacea]|uniref:Uncharacterized protein n=1 Tax=Mycena albidolilacea TaxID=1033008 RepID=A0AAD7A7M4_9AGAR|nr:hypothetical protein DFH08DRAFT_99102 [Mycena albidolilacea]